jgi:hypothetical protein
MEERSFTRKALTIEWYAAGKRRRKSVDRNPLDAFAAAECKEHIPSTAALGIQVIWEDNRKQTMLSEACQAFMSRDARRGPRLQFQRLALWRLPQKGRSSNVCGLLEAASLQFAAPALPAFELASDIKCCFAGGPAG